MRPCWRASSRACTRCREDSAGAREDRLEHRRARLLQLGASEKCLAGGWSMVGEGSPGGRPEPFALRLDRVLILQRPIPEERAIELLEIRVSGENVALDGGGIGEERLDPAGDLLLPLGTSEKVG